MKVEIINTGSELLLGNTLNTHLSYLGQELFPLGYRVSRQVTVPDGDDIRIALMEAMGRAQIILVTGGLGPTTDDITREVTAEMLGLPLVEDAAAWQAILDRFARRGLTVTERNRRQAQVPQGATVLQNPNGTAPGLYLRHQAGAETQHIFLLPGPPRELRPMFEKSVTLILKEIAPEDERVESRRWLVIGLGESKVESMVGEELLAIPGLELGYCARPGCVEVRCIGNREALEAAERIIHARLPAEVAGEGMDSLEEILIRKLAAAGKTIAVAESCTGGNLANRFTNVPGASEVFIAGYITYANVAKTGALGVPAEMISQHGAVSEPVAKAMAEGALRVAGTDYALSTTGIAGPGGGTPEKPVGTVFTALAIRGRETRVVASVFPTDRRNFKDLAAQAAMDLLRVAL
jgi:nicotinamide-nucleotide amidase